MRSFFETGDIPSECDFADLIESAVNRLEDNINNDLRGWIFGGSPIYPNVKQNNNNISLYNTVNRSFIIPIPKGVSSLVSFRLIYEQYVPQSPIPNTKSVRIYIDHYSVEAKTGYTLNPYNQLYRRLITPASVPPFTVEATLNTSTGAKYYFFNSMISALLVDEFPLLLDGNGFINLSIGVYLGDMNFELTNSAYRIIGDFPRLIWGLEFN